MYFEVCASDAKTDAITYFKFVCHFKHVTYLPEFELLTQSMCCQAIVYRR